VGFFKAKIIVMIKLILDGALFSECEMYGSNSYGMVRIAEEVIKGLIHCNEFDISFVNTIYSKKYDSFLKLFLENRYPAYRGKILSKTPILSSSLPVLSTLSKYFAKYLSLEVKNTGLDKGDIYHSFYYPFNKYLSRNASVKKSITYLDIIPLRMKGYNKAMVDITRQVVKSIVSNYAISISEFSRQDLLDYNKEISADRVFVAPLAASKELFFPNKNREDRARVKQKYGLPDNYFLTVSSTDIRKNISHLIKCFNQFVLQEKPQDLFLVLAGNAAYSHFLLSNLNVTKEVRNKIVISNRHIENKDLSVVYSNALCFFFMSLYEGFGLPVLEAMQCGVPVVASNITSLPEVAGNAAILINPKDEMALCSTMNEVYNNEALRVKYAALGIDRAKNYSWQKCADDYNSIFKKIALS
jgi:glycosyltransferase involved in cell wall biosynthesis